MSEELPVAVWSGEIMGVRVHVLDDGRRIIDAHDLTDVFERIAGGDLDPGAFGEAIAQFRAGGVKCESVIERTCVTCGSPHDKLATYTHRFVKPEVNALDLIAPGQRLPYTKGAAVAFGLMGMAEAIRDWPGIDACNICGKYSGGQCRPMPKDGVWPEPGYTCMRCFDAKRAREKSGHPYR